MAEERESGAMIEAAIMYVDPHAKQSQTAFIGKERVLLPYDKDSPHDLRNFKKHIIEYCGLDEQSRERGLCAQFAIKLYRLQRTKTETKSFSISTQQQWEHERHQVLESGCLLQGM